MHEHRHVLRFAPCIETISSMYLETIKRAETVSTVLFMVLLCETVSTSFPIPNGASVRKGTREHFRVTMHLDACTCLEDSTLKMARWVSVRLIQFSPIIHSTISWVISERAGSGSHKIPCLEKA